jgi:hypothetical protein
MEKVFLVLFFQKKKTLFLFFFEKKNQKTFTRLGCAQYPKIALAMMFRWISLEPP